MIVHVFLVDIYLRSHTLIRPRGGEKPILGFLLSLESPTYVVHLVPELCFVESYVSRYYLSCHS